MVHLALALQPERVLLEHGARLVGERRAVELEMDVGERAALAPRAPRHPDVGARGALAPGSAHVGSFLDALRGRPGSPGGVDTALLAGTAVASAGGRWLGHPSAKTASTIVRNASGRRSSPGTASNPSLQRRYGPQSGWTLFTSPVARVSIERPSRSAIVELQRRLRSHENTGASVEHAAGYSHGRGPA